MAKKTTKPLRIRVLLADDHPLVREGVRACLSGHGAFDVVGEASDGKEAVAMATEHKPDIVLMDISMPKLNGIAATREIHKIHPKVKVLFLTMHENKEYILEVARAGAQGYVLKDTPPDEMIRALQSVYAGETYFCSGATQVLVQNLASGEDRSRRDGLTKREVEVLQLIADGLSNKEIAYKLHVSVRTVETHRERIMRKLDIHSAAGLTKYAIMIGLTQVE